jgi:Cu/Ag efflux pump CusA
MDLAQIDRIAAEIERVVKQVPGVTSAFAERLTGGATSTCRSTAPRPDALA